MSVTSNGTGGYGSGPIRPAASGKPFTPTVGVGEGPGMFGGAAAAGATAVFVMAISSIALLQGAEAQRVMLTASLAMILFALVSFAPMAGIPASLVYLAFVGGLKRAFIPIWGYTALDPLLVVIPFVVLLSFMNRIIQRQVPLDTRYDKIMLALTLIMALEILNPFQGGLVVGLSGALFYIVPIMWYYVGRRVANDRLMRVFFVTFVVLAVMGGVYGLYQTWFGFSDVEQKWLDITKNENGLHLNAAVRVFSFFASFSEYCQMLVIAFVVCMAGVIRKNRPMIIVASFLFVCIVLSSSRGAVLGALLGLTVMWAVQGKNVRSWVPRLVVTGLVGILTIVVGLGQVANNTKLDAVTSDLVQHQASGLSDPFNDKKSTGGGHLSLIIGGISAGFRNPLGSGLGATTLAAGKFSSGAAGTEADYSNMFVSLGLVGGLLYVYLMYYTLRSALMQWKKTRTFVSLVVLGVLVCELNVWLVSGHYAPLMFIWFSIGWLGRNELLEKIKYDAAHPQKPLFRKRAARPAPVSSEPIAASPPPAPAA